MLPMPPWWTGLALSGIGLVLLALTTVLNVLVPKKLQKPAFWLSFLVFFLGLSLAVVLV
jgi:hypothetical protein